MSNPKIDPELAGALRMHAKDCKPMGAVFTLKTGPGQAFLPPDQVQTTVETILERVEHETEKAPLQINIFKNMGAFAVVADAPFVSELINQPEIATATANEQSEDMLIRPVHSRPVDGPRPGRGKTRR